MAKLYGNRWINIGNISGGGQGVVIKVEDNTNQLPGVYALKRLVSLEDSRMVRFKREIETLKRLNHPNILKIVDYNLGVENPYFVSEYCEGKSLKDKNFAELKGNISGIVAILLPIIDALLEAHKNEVIHRDIKPANILFRIDRTPVLADFGICHVEDGYSPTTINEGVGSKNFIAPELAAGGGGNVTEAADIYSLAKVFYWMVSGGLEFSREDHRARDRYLVTEQGQQFEHVHLLLDKFVVDELMLRQSLNDFRRQIQECAMLVEGNYVPLAPNLAIRCRFCGRGTYIRSTNRPGYNVPEAGLHVTSGHDVVAMWCGVCGHIETFNLKASGYREWWDAKNR